MKPEDQAAFEQAKNKTLTDERKLEIIKNSELWDMHIHMGWYSVPSKSFVEKSFKLIDDIQAACAHRDAQPAVACSFPERDVTKPAEEQGLFRKFDVRRVDGSDAPGGKHHGCEYFVLDLNHDTHAPAALRAYAQACNKTHPQLSAELLGRFGPQPAVAVNQRMRTALQEIANTVNYAQWYQETAEKALEDANHSDGTLNKVPAVAVNEQMYNALKMVMDDPQSLEGRPRTFKCVTEAIAAYEAAKKRGEM